MTQSAPQQAAEITVAGAAVTAVWLNTFSTALTILATLITIAWGVWRFWRDPEFRAFVRTLLFWRKK